MFLKEEFEELNVFACIDLSERKCIDLRDDHFFYFTKII